ncbi:hypothetical protein FVE85_8879 [Porphyridium purpureum]|uniref:Methyltransferase type 11 domain-containing protein n=1 Tax=Porphyridium purpureum TaxID=35688 RepID=A0A5J4YRS2_PORPP|nr:hypothetical protein FVE85_8879 [Porphyridium purpureum]|eukprot:POR6501..scf296_7
MGLLELLHARFRASILCAVMFRKPQLDKAHRRAVAAELADQNIRVEIVDAQSISIFAGHAFGLVTCCCAFLFCQKPLRVIREVRRGLKPGGTLSATHWRNLVIAVVGCAAVQAVLGVPPPKPLFNPMASAQPGVVEGYLSQDGFDPATTEVAASQYRSRFGEPREGRRMALMPVRDKLVELHEQETESDMIENAMDAAVKCFVELG